MIGTNFAAVRLAPPTSAPSTSPAPSSAARVVARDRAAIQHPHRARLVADQRAQLRPDRAMHRRDIRHRRRPPGADRPDRLVGDRQPVARRALGQRPRQLRRHHRLGLPGIALASVSPTHRIDVQPVPPRRLRLGLHVRIGLALIRAALAMPDDREARARLARPCAAETQPVCAPLSAACTSCAPIASAGTRAAAAVDQRRRHRDRDVARRARRAAAAIAVQLGQRGARRRSSSNCPPPACAASPLSFRRAG